jgi:pilus assembly protein TadC
MNYTKPITLTLYALALGYLLGQFLDFPFEALPWPYDTILGYVLGALFGFFITFELLAKWHTTRKTKIIFAVMLLVITYCIVEILSGLASNVSRQFLILDELQHRVSP